MSLIVEQTADIAAKLKPENFRRIVIKIGSALLVDRATGRLREDWLTAFVDDVAQLAAGGREILLVSSGAIALEIGRAHV